MNIERLAFAVSIKSTHTCGQVHEQIVHVKPDQDHSFDMRTDGPPFKLSGDPVHPFSWPDLTQSHTKLELKGYVGVVEMNGIEMRDHKIVCSKCGVDILFPGEEIEES